ncbi:hypothetical protein BpHYR1_017905 [Brachionus plicatilis]|uniref:Uncharacterized protein n=1 Tax=Brachionus plicatilis TaxID=10195 RepID=A0A3M7SX22_BRAPC|nr:hypothetical protein BpHYR1_017905 [Brachionus plicatilis]
MRWLLWIFAKKVSSFPSIEKYFEYSANAKQKFFFYQINQSVLPHQLERIFCFKYMIKFQISYLIHQKYMHKNPLKKKTLDSFLSNLTFSLIFLRKKIMKRSLAEAVLYANISGVPASKECCCLLKMLYLKSQLKISAILQTSAR